MLWNIILLFVLVLRVDSLLGNTTNTTPFAGETWSENKFRTVAYVIRPKNFTPQELPYQDLTHVSYAFASVNESTGEVYLSEIVDTKKLFQTDHLDTTEKNLYGNLKQLYLLKKRNRNLKVLLCISSGSIFTSSPISRREGRILYAQSSIKLLKDLGLDGLDIMESPMDGFEARDYSYLLKEVRNALDNYGQSCDPPHYFELSSSGPANLSMISSLNVTRLDPYLDFWNVQTYNYVRSMGPLSGISGHAANLYHSFDNPSSTPFDTASTINMYRLLGIPANKLVMGMPLYGQIFPDTTGPGRSFNFAGYNYRISRGLTIYNVKDLPRPGATEYWDPLIGSSFSYNNKTREMVSYDNLGVANQKAQYIIRNKLGGAIWMDSRGDRTGKHSLIQNVAISLGGCNRSTLARSLNRLSYADSIYANMRRGMPGE
ncbi:hypothetical protein VE04_03622 [Pseudogymnoascus sp. 24MN13]|nr:hypothetical protein VE04_03622 [Pseudogymnoascus sp. 24MN13]